MKVEDSAVLSNFFLDRGGKVGEIMKQIKWDDTPFGTLSQWPQNLSDFTAMVLMASQPMVLYWGDEYLTIFNDAFANTFLGNRDLEQKICKTAFEVMGDIWPDINERLTKVKDEKITGTKENILLKAHSGESNNEIHCNINKNLIYNLDATVAGVLATYTCSNFNKILNVAEKKVLYNEERLDLVIKASGLGIWEWIMATEEMICFPEYLAIYDFGPDVKLTRFQLESYYHPDDVQVRDDALASAQEKGNFNFQTRIITHIGNLKWVEIYGKIHTNELSGITSAVGTIRDITKEKERQILLQVNEKKFRDLSETSPVLIWMINLKFELEFVNESWFEFTGSNKENSIGEYLIHFIHKEDILKVEEIIHSSDKTFEDFTFEARMIEKNGDYRWMQITGRPRYNDRNILEGYIGACMDIHERIIFEQKLKENELKYKFLADTITHFIWTTNVKGEPLYYNKAFYDFTGSKFEDMQLEGWSDIVHPDDKQENIARWVESLKTGNPFMMEHRFRGIDGKYRWQLSRCIPQIDDSGNIIMWVGTSTDIEYIKKHEQEKNDFIKMANHELKTPVTTIKGYVQMMKRTHGNTDDVLLNQSLLTIDKQINKLTGLIGNLLDLTRIETGHIPLHKEPFVLTQLVEDTIEDIQTALPSHRLKVTESSYDTVLADKERISQVLVNLFTNAIKYSPLSAEVQISIKEKNGEVIVMVEDFGIGIAEQDQAQIFERFYRVEGKDEKTYPGFGIGLYIVKEIIQLHEGKLWVDSKKNEGSRFYFSLPKKEYITKR